MKKRRTFNLAEPTIYPPIIRSEVLPYNNDCELCFEKANDNQRKLLKCIYCNVVCHESCFNCDPSLAREIRETTEDPTTEMKEEKWKCFYCLESMNYERHYYQKKKDTLALDKQLFKAQVIISKTWRKTKVSKVYRAIRIGIVTFQRLYQVYTRKKAFSQKRGGSLRVMKLTISKLTNVFISERSMGGGGGSSKKNQSSLVSPAKSSNNQQKSVIEIYLLVSIYDLSQGSFTQSWKMESQVYMTHVSPENSYYNLTIDEDFILGGITSSQHIVITIFRKVPSGKEIFLGQASLELGLAFAWKKGGKFSLSLGGSAYELRDSSGMQLRCDFRFKPSGIIDFELCTSHGMTNNCCACYGTSVEEFLRVINKSSINAIGYTIVNRNSHNNVNNSTAGETGNLLVPPLFTSRSSFLSPVSSSLSLVNDSSSIASSITGKGSSISSLSRGTTAAGSRGVGGEGNLSVNTTDRSLPMKKMWIAFYLEKIFIFSHYGDALKLIIDLKFLNMTYEFGKNKNKKNHVIYKIEGNKSTGLPDFSFYPFYDHDIFVMRCSIISMVMLAKKLIPFISLFPEVIPTSCRSPLKSRSADCGIPQSSSPSPKRGGAGGLGGRRSSLSTFFSAEESSRKLLKTPTARLSSHPYTNQFFDWKTFIALWIQFDALKKKALQFDKPSPLTLSPTNRLKPLKSMSLSSFSNDSFLEPTTITPTSPLKTRLAPLSPARNSSTFSSFSFKEDDEDNEDSSIFPSNSKEKPERVKKSKNFLRRSFQSVPSPWSPDAFNHQLSATKDTS
jgi:hypothetical protein